MFHSFSVYGKIKAGWRFDINGMEKWEKDDE